MVTVTPYPSLGASAREARKAERAQKAASSRVRRTFKRLLATTAILFAMLGFGGGTAHAWPWDVAENVTAFITNFCGPNDVSVNDFRGVDNASGLNHPDEPKRDTRATVFPKEGASGTGLARINTAFGDERVTNPTYERYGFSTLRWTNYGSGCFTMGHWFTPVTSGFFQILVNMPMIMGMATMRLVFPDDGTHMLYQFWTSVFGFYAKAFTDIFTPFALLIAPIGVGWVWWKSKGSLQAVTKAMVWVLMIFGTMVWMGSNTSTIVTKANTFVASFATTAAEKINEHATGAPSGGSGLDGVNQTLWHGVSYQTWLNGEVGPQQAYEDLERERSNQVGWGPAILNGLYVGTDDAGRKRLTGAVNDWNSHSYAPEEDGFVGDASTKVSDWTDDEIWKDVPFLYTVGAMCNDDFDGGGSTDPKDNRWMYGGSCDSAGAGTSHMVPYFQGNEYNNQMVVVATGFITALAIFGVITLASIYLGIQMIMFFFFMLFAPVFLTVSMFADEKRRRFATRYFELLMANIIKQCVAVLGILFVAHAMSTLMQIPAATLPWMLKPLAALLFLGAIILFMFPLASIVKAAAKGDTSVVDKMYNAPAKAATTTAKVAVAAAAIAATAGAAAPLLGGATGALGSGKAASLLTSGGRALGSRGGVGKAMTSAGRLMRAGNAAGGMMNDQMTARKVRTDGISKMLSGATGAAYKASLAKTPGMVDKAGNLTKAGMKRASKDYAQSMATGLKGRQADRMQKEHMSNFFAGHRMRAGASAAEAAGIDLNKDGTVKNPAAAAAAGLALDGNGRPISYHELDPQNPEVKARAESERAQQRHAAWQKDAFNRNADPNAAAAAGSAGAGAATVPRGTFSPNTPINPQTGLPVDPGAAAAVVAGVNLNPDGTVADPEAAKAAGVHVDSDNRPITAAAAGAASRAGGPDATKSANVSSADPNASAEEVAKKGFAEKARDRVDGPSFSKDENIKATVEATGVKVLSDMKVTHGDVVADPSTLLTGTAYRNGDVSAMDPKHPATAAMTDLKFAISGGASDEQIETASARAQQALATHGVPDQIASISSTGATAEKFSSADVVGAMPSLGAESTWQERAEAAKTMNAAAAAMPEGHEAAPEVRTYISALNNPAVPTEEVDHLKAQAVMAFDQADQKAAVASGEAVQPSLFESDESVPAGARVSAGSVTPASAPSDGGVAVAAAAFPVTTGGRDNIAEPVAAQMSALDEQADRAVAYAQTDSSPAAQEAASRAMAASPKHNPDLASASSAVADLPQDHVAHGALATYATVASDQNSTQAQRNAALEQVQESLGSEHQPTLPGMPTGAAMASPAAAAAVAAGMGGATPAPETNYFPKDVDTFDSSVSGAAQQYGALPMASEDQNLGYSTSIGGQTYTAASRAPLDALNAHATNVVNASDGYSEENAGEATQFAQGNYESRVADVAQQHYGVTPVGDGEAGRGFTATVAGQRFTAESPEALEKFQSDVKTYADPQAEQVDPTTPVSDSQAALSSAREQYRADANAVADVGWHRQHADAADASVGLVPETGAPRPTGPDYTTADAAFAEKVTAAGVQHYGVEPVSNEAESKGYTAMVGGQRFTADNPEALDTFRSDVDTFAASGPDQSERIVSSGQQQLMDAHVAHEGDRTMASEQYQSAQAQPETGTQGQSQQDTGASQAPTQQDSGQQDALFDMPAAAVAGAATSATQPSPAERPTSGFSEEMPQSAHSVAQQQYTDALTDYQDQYSNNSAEVGGVTLTPSSGSAEMREAAQHLPEGHPGRAAVDDYVQALDSGTDSMQAEDSRESALRALAGDGLVPTRPQEPSTPAGGDFTEGTLFSRDAAAGASDNIAPVSEHRDQHDSAPAVAAAGFVSHDGDQGREAAPYRDDASQPEASPEAVSYEAPSSQDAPSYQEREDFIAAAGSYGVRPAGDEQGDLGYTSEINGETFTASEQSSLDGFRDMVESTPDGAAFAAAGYVAGSMRDDDRGADQVDMPAEDFDAPSYEVPAEQRPERQAEVDSADSAGGYAAFAANHDGDGDGPSFAAESMQERHETPSFTDRPSEEDHRGPLVDQDGYGPEGYTRSGGIDHDGYGAGRERPDEYYNEGVDRDGYGAGGMERGDAHLMSDPDGYGAGRMNDPEFSGEYRQPGLSGEGDEQRMEATHYQPESLREGTGGQEQVAESTQQQDDGGSFHGADWRSQDDDRIMSETLETADRSDGARRDERDFGPERESGPSFSGNGDRDEFANAPEARVDREDLREALREERDEERYLRSEYSHSDAPTTATAPEPQMPSAPVDHDTVMGGDSTPVAPSHPADRGPRSEQPAPAMEDGPEANDSGSMPRSDEQDGEVQQYFQTRRRRFSKFFGGGSDNGDSENRD